MILRTAAVRWFGSVGRVFLISLSLAEPCLCQPADAQSRLLPEACPPGVNFEHAGYTVGSSKIHNPFDFLPWVRIRDRAAGDEISKMVDGQPFRYASVVGKALDAINEQDFFPQTSFATIRVRVELVVAHCSGKTVDLIYQIYSSQVLPGATGTPEAQEQAQQSPQSAAGLTEGSAPGSVPLKLTPSFGFDSTDKLYAGGQTSVMLCSACGLPLRLIADGQGSQSMRTFHAAVKGSQDSHGPIVHSDYLLNYNMASLPTGAGQLRSALTSGQYSGTTSPFFNGNVSARFGGLIEKGTEQAQIGSGVPKGALPASAVNAVKLYGGLDSRLPNNVLSASMGLELGAVNVASGVQWKKYIGDVRHDFWHTVGDHHSLDVESRFTVGAIQTGAGIPVAERFFGGNYEQLFMPDDSWQIRASPVIRAIPGSRFYLTQNGAGADRFAAYNLTAAFGVWRKPLVPPEVDKDPEFMTLLNGQLNTATSFEQLYFVTKDANYQAIVAELPRILAALNGLSNAVGSAQRAHPEQATAKMKSCASAVKMALNRATSAQSSSSAAQYGLVSALLKVDPDEDRLSKIVARCGDADLSAPGLLSNGDLQPVVDEQTKIEADFKLIDQTAAAKKAASDMLFVRRTLHTLFRDVNLISLSPVAVFDVANIGPAIPGTSGTRYGPGAGLRLELASAVHFTVGYARNLSPGPGEGSGSVFFSMGTRDLFH